MKIHKLFIALVFTIGLISCKKQEVAEQPPISTLTTGTWTVVGIQYTNEDPGSFYTVKAEEATVSGTVTFTLDSMYHNANGMGFGTVDSSKNPFPVMINDSRHGPFTIIDDDRFTMVDKTSSEVLTYEGLGRSENSMHLKYDLKSQMYISLDSIVQLKETYILELSR